MQKMKLILAALAIFSITIIGCKEKIEVKSFDIELSASNLDLHNIQVKDTTFLGENALKVSLTDNFSNQILIDGANGTLNYSPNGQAVVSDFKLHNGTIEFDMALEIQNGFPPFIRGFGGIVFRLQTLENYDCIYLRGTNGSLNTPATTDTTRLNHAIQYIKAPNFEFQELRDSFPEVYENPAAIAINSWHHYKFVVKESRAEVYIDYSTSATLIVENMFGQNTEGDIGLFSGLGTNVYFKNMNVVKD